MLKRKSQAEATPAPSTGRKSTDPLTGIPDRTNLLSSLQTMADRARSTSVRMGLFFISIAHVQDMNDAFGPDRGDELLRDVAQRLSGALESGQRLLRYNGAEFALLAEGVDTVERAQQLAEHLLDALGAPFPVGGAEFTVGASIGLALSDQGYADPKAWLDDAHHAVSEAREQGNRSVVVHDESTRNRINVQINEDRIRRAFEKHEFVVVYQPIVTPGDEHVVGFEALLRWLDPGSGAGLIPPGQFLPLLEKTGLITPVGTWALQEATRQIKGWNDLRPDKDPFFISVNLGAKQLAQTSFAESVAKALDLTGLAPELLSLDITPAAISYNRAATWSALRDLKYLGIRIALDDFGTGDSTLAYLRELQLDLVRIDRMFVEGLGRTPEDTAIVRHSLALCRELGILALAEGVERADQLEALREMNCPLAQGYYFGKAEPAFELESRLSLTR